MLLPEDLSVSNLVFWNRRRNFEQQPKKPLKEGFDKERFVEQPLDEYICPICIGVVREPRECSACGILICAHCEQSCQLSNSHLIEMITLSRSFSCPICRSTKPFVEPSKVLLKLIGNLPIRCKNYLAGCLAILPLAHVKEHQKVCEFHTTKCRNTALCQNRGKPSDFITMAVPEALRAKYNSKEQVYVCSNICREVFTMELCLELNDTESAIKMYQVALERLETLPKQ